MTVDPALWAYDARVAQNPIEIILSRELTSCLETPVFLVDPDGNLLYYNEPAEAILGQRFNETGAMSAEEWSTAFKPSDMTGKPLPPEELPLVIALTERRPAHRRMLVRGLDGTRRKIEVTAVPLEGQGHRHLGAIAIFWEVADS